MRIAKKQNKIKAKKNVNLRENHNKMNSKEKENLSRSQLKPSNYDEKMSQEVYEESWKYLLIIVKGNNLVAEMLRNFIHLFYFIFGFSIS